MGMKCSWCGALLTAGQTTCAQCGVMLTAAVAAANAAGAGNWAQLPGRKDLAQFQFGHSSCQIEGRAVPVADFKLAAEDWILFAHHVLLWKDPQVALTAVPQDGPWRTLAGQSHLMMEARGPGHIAISHDSPGELIALPLQPGQHVHVRQQAQTLKQERSQSPARHSFLAATGNVTYSSFDPNVWFHIEGGALAEDHRYPVGKTMDMFGAKDAPGLLFLHAPGNVFVRQLTAGQHILVRPPALVFKDSIVKMDLYYEIPSGALPIYDGVTRHWNSGSIWLRLHGPGRAAIQSVFERLEDENLFTLGYNRHSEMAVYPPGSLKGTAPPRPPPGPAPTKKLLGLAGILATIDGVGILLFRHFVLGPASNFNNVNNHVGAFFFLLITCAVTFILLVIGLFCWLANRSRR